tara:strand:+ start:4880 stop:5155 length:276 start_codon:yes stop_codon:yes gene_type:complete
MKSDPEKLTEKHRELTHSDERLVISHVQRESAEWFVNTLMIEDCDIPFKYRRKKRYKSLQGQRVNLTYYPGSESIAGLEIDIMNIVRIKRS